MSNVSRISKPRCHLSENELHHTFDLRLHCAAISTIGSRADFSEFLERFMNETFSVRAKVECGGHDNNPIYVYSSNLNPLSTALNLQSSTLRLLAGCVQVMDSGETRLFAVGSALRTDDNPRFRVSCCSARG